MPLMCTTWHWSLSHAPILFFFLSTFLQFHPKNRQNDTLEGFDRMFPEVGLVLIWRRWWWNCLYSLSHTSWAFCDHCAINYWQKTYLGWLPLPIPTQQLVFCKFLILWYSFLHWCKHWSHLQIWHQIIITHVTNKSVSPKLNLRACCDNKLWTLERLALMFVLP